MGLKRSLGLLLGVSWVSLQNRWGVVIGDETAASCVEVESQWKEKTTELQKKIETLTSELSSTSNEKSKFQSELKDEKEKRATIQAELSDLRQAFEKQTSVADEVKQLQGEKTTLMESRIKLAAELEKANTEMEQLKVDKARLESFEVNHTKASQDLVTCKNTSKILEEKNSKIESDLEEIESKRRSSETQLEQIRLENEKQKLLVDDLRVRERDLSQQLASHKKMMTLFSWDQLKQFDQQLRSFTYFLMTRVTREVIIRIPPSAWEKTDAAKELFWNNFEKGKTAVQPHLEKAYSTAKPFYEEAKTVLSELYVTHGQPLLSTATTEGAQRLRELREVASVEWQAISGILNSKLSDCIQFFTHENPEVAELIPSSLLDRFVFICVYLVCLYFMVRKYRWVLFRLVFPMLRLGFLIALPCCWCRLCRRRPQPLSLVAEPNKKKGKKGRAAGAVQSDSNSTTLQETKKNGPPTGKFTPAGGISKKKH